MGSSKAAAEGLKWDFHDLSFSVNKTRRYHEKLVAFYSGWSLAFKIATVFAGSSAFLLLFSDVARLAQFFAAGIAVWAILDIILAPEKSAEHHRSLCQRFLALAAKMAEAPRTRREYNSLFAQRLTLEKDERPVKRLVDLQARNEECRARDFPSDMLVPLDFWQRHLGYFATFGMKRLEKWKAEHAVTQNQVPITKPIKT